MIKLTVPQKEELALALILWKDFKSDGKMNFKISMDAVRLCQLLGVEKEFNELLVKLPPMRVIPR